MFDVVREQRLNHQVEVMEGVLAAECAEIMQNMFEGIRRKNRPDLTEGSAAELQFQ